MKSRALLFGTVYNPFIMRYWLDNFKLWQHKVDKVYICFDRFHLPEVDSFLGKEIAKFPKIEMLRGLGGWPTNMEIAIKTIIKEDLILTIHDDTYIYNPDILDEYFDMAEKGKVVTPLFVDYSPEVKIREVVKEKYPFMPWEFEGYVSCSFIQYFIFCSRENYLKADADFTHNVWKKGEYIPELDYTTDCEFGADAGFKFGLQLLANGIEVVPIKPNNLVNVPHQSDPLAVFNKMVDDGLDWLHLQNISNTIPLWFYERGEEGHKIHELAGYRDNKAVVEGNTMRIAWLEEFMAVDNYEEIKDFRDYILKEKEYIIDYFGIDRDRIAEYRKIINRLTGSNK